MRKGVLGLGKLKLRSNKEYNAEFAGIIKDLDSRPETYNIVLGTFSNPDQAGEFRYLGNNQFNIVYSNPGNTFGGSAANVLFEEVFHAHQFTQGKFLFQNNNGVWAAPQVNAEDEWEAKTFALAPGYNNYAPQGGVQIKTQLGFIASLTKAAAIDYLVHGTTGLVLNQYGSTTTNTYQAPYPFASVTSLRSNLTVRTFGSQIAGYPYVK